MVFLFFFSPPHLPLSLPPSRSRRWLWNATGHLSSSFKDLRFNRTGYEHVTLSFNEFPFKSMDTDLLEVLRSPRLDQGSFYWVSEHGTFRAWNQKKKEKKVTFSQFFCFGGFPSSLSCFVWLPSLVCFPPLWFKIDFTCSPSVSAPWWIEALYISLLSLSGSLSE